MTPWITSPTVWIAVGAVTTLLPMALGDEASWPVSLGALCVFSAAGPVMCGLGQHWWRDILLTLVAWVVIFVALGQLPATSRMREGAMVFMLPMLILPLAVVAGGLIRLVRRRRT